MTLKETIEQDNSTFLNLADFAETHEISDGVNATTCAMVISKAGDALINGVQLVSNTVNITLATENVPAGVSYGTTIFIDGVTYDVMNTPIDNIGTTELTLKQKY